MAFVVLVFQASVLVGRSADRGHASEQSDKAG